MKINFKNWRDELFKRIQPVKFECEKCGKEISENDWRYSGKCDTCFSKERVILKIE